MTQDQALRILKSGANVFLTGEPGSGKTHTVNEYVAYLRERGVEPAITASTGIAATHIGGMTIHSWSGVGIKTNLTKYDLDKIASTEYVAKRVLRAKILIIDEVSMLLPEMLAMVDAVCREIKRSPEPFGGIQVVLVGDFFQLPPIMKTEAEKNGQAVLMKEPPARFAYSASAWARANPVVCYLTEQHRQDDRDFLSILSAIRSNAFGGDHLRHIETRKIEHRHAPDGAPKLFSHNADVDRVNNETLAKLPGELHAFAMSSLGRDTLVAALQKGCLSPERLCLKVGAAVMFTKNNPKEGFVNGTLGTVLDFDKSSGHPIVKTRNGRRIAVGPMDWKVEENGKVRARIMQLPLRLAWAITVHKSQGMSLDEAVMDLSQVFEFGQGYVALSRIRRLSGLHLLGWNERTFQVHPEIVGKDESFRAASEEAEMAFAKIPPTELAKMHENFIVACGGKNIFARSTSGSKKNGSGTSFGKIREKHPNAYRPWDKAQDEKLKDLFANGLSISGLGETFGRKSGAIRARLVKLGLMEWRGTKADGGGAHLTKYD
ncbi:MAG: PIF1 family DEAD/DEAH box helicase [Patescibacteria group bacterium]